MVRVPVVTKRNSLNCVPFNGNHKARTSWAGEKLCLTGPPGGMPLSVSDPRPPAASVGGGRPPKAWSEFLLLMNPEGQCLNPNWTNLWPCEKMAWLYGIFHNSRSQQFECSHH
jgi:hypothetical protein